MSQPHPNVPKPVDPPADPVGGHDPTLQATGDHGDAPPRAADPTLQATMNFTPPGGEATLEVTNLAFPRPHAGPDPGATVQMAPTIPPRPHRPRSDSDTAPTLDGDAKTNAFSMSSVDGTAEVVFNDLPFVQGYNLLSELGRGGMGVVYKARQEKLDRLVALKMVLAGAHASADQLNRFLIEAQAVAHLTHNHIVQIYDVGERDNLPFFSLEYIDGGSLQQAINGKPQPVRHAAKTVKTLCEAMGFAHDQGIIHRDLKPANVLMTKAGEPKITDFGLAKRLEGNSQQTRDGAIMGTPSYMAPEQAWGLTQEIGPLADQHALGAILYEMLTGRPPYQGATPLDTLDQVRNQEPVAPTRLQPKVPKDLETICLKALQKDAHKRYATAKAMADDLGRYLDEKPILARPVAAPERLYRWAKRNKGAAAAIATVTASLVAIAGGSVAAAVVINGKNNALTAATVLAQANEKKALDRERETRALASAAIDQTGTMLESQRYVTVMLNGRLRDIPNTFDARREMFKVALMTLERSIKDIDKLRKHKAGSKISDAFTLRTLAGVHQNRGELYAQMPSKKDLVWPEFEAMRRLADQHYAEAPDDLEAIKNMAASRLTLGDYTFALKGDVAAAVTFFREAIDYRRKWLAREPESDTAKQGMANALGALARIYLNSGSSRDAISLYDEEVKFREAIVSPIALDTEFRRETAGLHEKLGDLNVSLERFQEGRDHYYRSLEMRQAFLKEFPDHPQAGRDVALSLQKRGIFYETISKDPRAALKDYEEAARTFQDLYKIDPKDTNTWVDLARVYYYLGTACLAAKDLPASDAAYAESLKFAKSLVGTGPLGDNNRQAYINLMLRLARTGDHGEAAKIASELVKNPPDNSYILFQAACGFALAAGAADRHHPEDKTLALGYRESAMSALRMALARGWHSPQDVAADPDLEPLRSSTKFPALLEEFRKADAADKAQAEKKG